MYSRIIGTGKYLPEKILTNADLEKMVDTTDEWIRTRTGIEHRHIAADDEATSDLAYKASLVAMKDAGVAPSDIDLVLVGTTTPDLIFPNVGCLVQEKLGISGCPAFSLEAACSGFLYSLVVADQFIRMGQARRALVIGAETMSRIIDWTDRETCVLFGDGAGAVILEAAEKPGVIYSTLGADGRYRWHWDPGFMSGTAGPGEINDQPRMLHAAQRLRVPSLLVRGQMSDVISLANAREFLKAAPEAEFVDVAGAGHMVAGDRNDASPSGPEYSATSNSPVDRSTSATPY